MDEFSPYPTSFPEWAVFCSIDLGIITGMMNLKIIFIWVFLMTKIVEFFFKCFLQIMETKQNNKNQDN